MGRGTDLNRPLSQLQLFAVIRQIRWRPIWASAVNAALRSTERAAGVGNEPVGRKRDKRVQLLSSVIVASLPPLRGLCSRRQHSINALLGLYHRIVLLRRQSVQS